MQKEFEEHDFIPPTSQTKPKNNITSYFIFTEQERKHEPLNLLKRLLPTQRDLPLVSLSPLDKQTLGAKTHPCRILKQSNTREKG